jgi:hypothetical protein
MQLKKIAAVGLAIIAPFSLSGCLLLPGEFTSEMTVMADGQFAFSYKGQIQLVGLANMLHDTMYAESTNAEFSPVCYGSTGDADASLSAAPAMTWAAETITADVQPEEDFGERECTPEEIEQQKKEWEEQQANSKKEKEQAKKMFAAMIGGVDPSNPKTIDRFAKEVERLAAWNKVEHLGNGLFMIDYATKGRLADDFAFPIIPRYALGNPMVHVTRWDDGRVRIEAPTFHNDADMSLASLMGAGSMIPGIGGSKTSIEPVEVKGTFTIRTNAKIMANNTDEGPTEEGALQVLRWEVGPKSYGPPMALLKLAN